MTVSLYSMSICSGFHSSVLTHFICLNLYSPTTRYMSNVAKRIHFRFRSLVEVNLLRFNFHPIWFIIQFLRRSNLGFHI